MISLRAGDHPVWLPIAKSGSNHMGSLEGSPISFKMRYLLIDDQINEDAVFINDFYFMNYDLNRRKTHF
jgi:hypothetical protein